MQPGLGGNQAQTSRSFENMNDYVSLAYPATPLPPPPPPTLCILRCLPRQVSAAMVTAHQESLSVMSKRLAELYSEMGLPVGAGGMPGQ